MKNKIFEINVDFETKSAVDTDLIKIVKGDYNSIEFDLKMDKTDYKRAVLFLVKPSKKNFVVDIANSKAIFTEKNTFDEVGIYYYGIVLYGTNSKLTTSTKGKIQVVEGYNEDNEDITGDDNYPILDKLIEEVTDLKDKINASLGVMNKTFKEVTYDPTTGVMSFKNLNNEVTNINLPLSLLISSASYDNDNKKIVLTLANNDTIDIPILDLVSNYYDDKINANKEYIASTSNELYRLKTDVLETGESSRNNIHLEDSAWSELQELSVDGVCKQETTTGKNKLPNNATSRTINGVTFTKNSNGTVVANGTATASCFYNIISNNEVPITTTNLLLSGCPLGGTSSSYRLRATYTDSSYSEDTGNSIKLKDGKVLQIVTIVITNGTTCNNLIFKPMISSDGGEYEPYTGVQPSPSPDYPQPISVIENSLKITSCNKNLYFTDKEVYSYTTTNSSWKFLNGNSDADTSESNKTIYKAKVEKGKTYTFSANITSSANIISTLMYDTNIQIARIDGTNINYNNTFTSNIDGYVLLRNYINSGISVEISNVMLVEGQATEYEPYQETKVTFELPEGEFVGKLDDTYKDTLNVVYKDDGHYHLMLNKMIGKVVLDGSEEGWLYDSNNKYFRTNTYVFERIPLSLSSENKAMYSQISNSFIINKNWSGTNSFRDNLNVQGEFYPVQNVGYKLTFRNLNFDNVDDFKSWLSTHNTEVYYPLATPYEIDLGTVDTLLTFDEITNIFTDSDLYPIINVKYYRNFIKTIQNLQVNNDTLKNELSNIESRLVALENANTSEIDNNPSDDTQESEVTE